MLTTSSQFSLNETRIGTLQCKGLQSPLLFVAMLLHGDIGYNETIVRQEDGSLKLIAEQNPMNAPG